MARMTRLLSGRLRPVLAFTDECNNCAEPLNEGCFCDADFRDGHERRFWTRIINGVQEREVHDGYFFARDRHRVCIFPAVVFALVTGSCTTRSRAHLLSPGRKHDYDTTHH